MMDLDLVLEVVADKTVLKRSDPTMVTYANFVCPNCLQADL